MRSPAKHAMLALAAMVTAFAGTSAQPPPRRDSIRVTASPGLVNFALLPSGISRGSLPITITTSWQIQRGGVDVSMFAYFSNPAVAISNARGVGIPSSRIFGKVNTGSFLPFTGSSSAGPGGSLLVFSQQVRGNRTFTRADSLELQIDTTGLNLGPGTYSGAMRIQAQAI